MGLIALDLSNIDFRILFAVCAFILLAFVIFVLLRFCFIKYKVKYYVNGKLEKTEKYCPGKVVNTMVPEVYGQKFCGWFLDENFKGAVREAFAMPNYSIELYAKLIGADESEDEDGYSEEDLKRIVKEAVAEAIAEIKEATLEKLTVKDTVTDTLTVNNAVKAKEAAPAVVVANASDEESDDEGDSDADEVYAYTDTDGEHKVTIRYRKSFKARYIQTSDETKQFYSDLKNYLNGFDLSNRMSWNYESFNKGRKQLVKINVSGKTLVVYLATDPKTLEGTKYNFEDVSDKKRYEKVPTKVKVRSNLALKKVSELIGALMAENEVETKEEPKRKYYEKYAERKELIKKELIKVYAKDLTTGETLSDEKVDVILKQISLK